MPQLQISWGAAKTQCRQIHKYTKTKKKIQRVETTGALTGSQGSWKPDDKRALKSHLLTLSRSAHPNTTELCRF